MRTAALSFLWPLALPILIAGCSPAQIGYVNGGIQIAGVACQGYAVASGNPALAPICATAEEFMQAIAELAEQANKAHPAAAKVPPTTQQIYNQILADRAKKATSK